MGEKTELWNKGNNLLSLYYYKFKTDFLGVDEHQLAELVGVSLPAFKKHSSNFHRIFSCSDGFLGSFLFLS